MKKQTLLGFLLILSYCISAQWRELGGYNALAADNEIYSVCSDHSGNIYAAGAFYDVSTGFNYVAKYNGSVWSVLGGSGLPANGYINSICSDLAGNIYAAGNFTNSGGKYYVAKYDGSSWSELGGLNGLAANGNIATICSDASGNIYAAGSFSNGTSIYNGNRYVAKYNGSSWSELGGVNALAADNDIYTVCSDASGNIYAAGTFINIDSNRYVAKYNGSSWSELGGLNALATKDGIYSVCTDPLGNIYAAGGLINIDTNYYVAKYNGSNWSQLTGINGPVDAVCSDASGNIYAGGTLSDSSHKYCVTKYNGTNWSILGGSDSLAANEIILTVCTDPYSNVYAAGWFTNGSTYSTGKYYVAKYGRATGTNVYAHLYDTICQGASASVGGHTYTAAGTYTDTLTATGGGDSIITLTLTVNPLPVVTLSWQALVGVQDLTSYFGDTLWVRLLNMPKVFPAMGGYPLGGKYSGTYIRNDTFDFTTITSSIGFLRDTIYYSYTDSNGCTAVTSNVFFLSDVVGIDEINPIQLIHLYPNPNRGSFTLTTDNSQLKTNFYTISDMLGHIIMQRPIRSDNEAIDLPDAAEGVYTLSVTGAQPIRFVVMR